MNKHCVLCGHLVGQGDRHGKLACPPPKGKRGAHAALRRRRLGLVDPLGTARGMPVAGTGVPKGARGT